MANLWSDGFGRYGGTEAFMLNGSSGQAWAQVDSGAGGWNLDTANPRTGTYHLRMVDASGEKEARRVFGVPLTEVFFGQALFFEQLPTEEPLAGAGVGIQPGFFLAEFRSGANDTQVSVWLGTDGAIAVYRGGHDATSFVGTLLGRTAPCIGAGAYQHIEHYLKIHNSTGAYEVRVDEVTKLNLTGIDTDLGAAEVSQVVVGRSNSFPFGATGMNVDMADCYVNDTTDDSSGCDTFIGDVKSGVLMVNADTAQADFVLSSGVTGYTLLNEIPPVDGGYISTTSATAESNFGLQDGPANLSEILTVRPFVRALKDDAGTCTIAPSMISNAVKATVTPQPITTAAAYYDSNVPLDPDTAAPWDAVALAAALHVVERTA